jgi:hypothetical protein
VISLVFGFLAFPWVPWALSLVIVAVAALTWLDFRWNRLDPVVRGLDDAIRAIEETEGPGTFRQRFATIFQRLADNPVTGDVWRAYATTLAPAPTNEGTIGYTRRPAENFNEGLLAVAGINLRFYHAMPNLLVGLGLLFTFIGLIGALYFASAGVSATDVKIAQTALRDLLAAATFKFATSIAGLASSMAFSWREKAQLYRVHRRLARLCAALEARMVPVTPESLASAELAELKSQTALLKRLSRDLFIRLPEAAEERLEQELAQGMAPVRRALGEAAQRLRLLDAMALEAIRAAMMPEPVAEPGPAAAAEPSAAPAPEPVPDARSSTAADQPPEEDPPPVDQEPQPSPAKVGTSLFGRAKPRRVAPTLRDLRGEAGAAGPPDGGASGGRP